MSDVFTSALDNDLDIAYARECNPYERHPLAKHYCVCTHKAEAHIVVAVPRPIVVTVGRAQVGRIVVPAAATYDAVGAPCTGRHANLKDSSKIPLLTLSEFT